MGDPLATVTDDRLRMDPGDLPRQRDRVRDPGGTAASGGPTETEAEVPGEEVKEEETAPGGELRAGGKETQPDGMVELKEDVERTHEPIPGKCPVDWARCSGPHWPPPETDPTEGWVRLLSRTRWPTGIR